MYERYDGILEVYGAAFVEVRACISLRPVPTHEIKLSSVGEREKVNEKRKTECFDHNVSLNCKKQTE